jgi:hypothetical protein
MKARSILFSGAMVRANLADIKTQTRRVVKLTDEWHPDTRSAKVIGLGADGVGAMPFDEFGRMLGGAVRCPYGQPGDRLWVREAFRLLDVFDCDSPNTVADRCLNAGYSRPWAPTHYEADGYRNNWQHVGTPPHEGGPPIAGKLRPGIHMPRWASRILLEIVAIRVERLQDISEADARAEGIEPMFLGETPDMKRLGARVQFKELWERINGPGSWDANPWVWVIEFRRTPHG